METPSGNVLNFGYLSYFKTVSIHLQYIITKANIVESQSSLVQTNFFRKIELGGIKLLGNFNKKNYSEVGYI